jgi:hypothetical protein
MIEGIRNSRGTEDAGMQASLVIDLGGKPAYMPKGNRGPLKNQRG